MAPDRIQSQVHQTTDDDFQSTTKNGDSDSEIAIRTDTYAINKAALGTELPANYWQSPRFLGTVAALIFGNMSAFASWVMPSNSLAIINQSIGPSNQISWVALAFTLGLSVGFLIVGRLSGKFLLLVY